MLKGKISNRCRVACFFYFASLRKLLPSLLLQLRKASKATETKCVCGGGGGGADGEGLYLLTPNSSLFYYAFVNFFFKC